MADDGAVPAPRRLSLLLLVALCALIVAGSGLSGMGVGRAVEPSDGPSFDCSRARGVIETAICRSPALSELDGRLDFVYRDALAGAGPRQREDIRNDQRQWLNSRASCSRESALERCLTRLYLARISRLEPKR